jgi:predicted ester cyclase
MYRKKLKFSQTKSSLNQEQLQKRIAKKTKLALIVMVLLMAMVGVAACQTVRALPKRQTTSSASSAISLEEANKAIVERFYEEVMNQKNLDALGELFDANLIVHDLDFGANGIDLPAMLASMPDFRATTTLWVVKDDLVTAVVTYNGTHTGGELLGVPATGKPVTFSIIDIVRIKDGKIAELWHNVPTSDILEQIQP